MNAGSFRSAATVLLIVIAALGLYLFILRKISVPLPDEGPGLETYESSQYGFSFRYPPGGIIGPLPEPDPRAETGFRLVLGQGRPNASADFTVAERGTFSADLQALRFACGRYQASEQQVDNRSVALYRTQDCGMEPPILYALVELDGGRELLYAARLDDPFMAERDYAYRILQTLDIFPAAP